MQKYKDIHGDSGIAAYEIGLHSITISFKTGGTYLYDYASTGKRSIETMKKLAASGNGLATYINQKVRKRYAAKLA